MNSLCYVRSDQEFIERTDLEANVPTTTQALPQIPGFTSGRVPLGDVTIHYRSGGDPAGEPVLLWHGFLGTSYTWRKVAVALAEAGRAVLVPDMRGYGDSSKPQGDQGYDAAGLAEEFRAVADALSFGSGRPITLVAHDWGAPAALLWAAGHPDEIARLFYIDIPVLLPEPEQRLIAFTARDAGQGSLWWWLAALAPGLPEKLIVGNERAFLEWFYERSSVTAGAIEPYAVNEYLRTFAGREAVLASLGVFRTVFESMKQTATLLSDPVRIPVVGLGGERSRGETIGRALKRVAEDVQIGVIPESGHFVPEERPDELVRWILDGTHR
jgi:pimeloyl-ACP methyl ester carboxylesterase